MKGGTAEPYFVYNAIRVGGITARSRWEHLRDVDHQLNTTHEMRQVFAIESDLHRILKPLAN